MPPVSGMNKTISVRSKPETAGAQGIRTNALTVSYALCR